MERIDEQAQELYELILQTANRFLRNAKMFEMHVLRDHNPTYEELARIMHSITVTITDLVDDKDPMLGQKAKDYTDIMKNMGQAITQNDDNRLKELIGILEKKPGL